MNCRWCMIHAFILLEANSPAGVTDTLLTLLHSNRNVSFPLTVTKNPSDCNLINTVRDIVSVH